MLKVSLPDLLALTARLIEARRRCPNFPRRVANFCDFATHCYCKKFSYRIDTQTGQLYLLPKQHFAKKIFSM